VWGRQNRGEKILVPEELRRKRACGSEKNILQTPAQVGGVKELEKREKKSGSVEQWKK
jgi:hypothetical protein